MEGKHCNLYFLEECVWYVVVSQRSSISQTAWWKQQEMLPPQELDPIYVDYEVTRRRQTTSMESPADLLSPPSAPKGDKSSFTSWWRSNYALSVPSLRASMTSRSHWKEMIFFAHDHCFLCFQALSIHRTINTGFLILYELWDKLPQSLEFDLVLFWLIHFQIVTSCKFDIYQVSQLVVVLILVHKVWYQQYS